MGRRDPYLLAIDPGPEMSAAVWLTPNGGIHRHKYDCNEEILVQIVSSRKRDNLVYSSQGMCIGNMGISLVIEMFNHTGMPIGVESFNTLIWIGLFLGGVNCCLDEAYKKRLLVTRGEVKMHLCQSMRAKDSNIRAAIIGRYGKDPKKVIGTKKNPGPLYGISTHKWAALAVGLTWLDQHPKPADWPVLG